MGTRPHTKFQSHNGSIKALHCAQRRSNKSLFQSHNGSIKAGFGSNALVIIKFQSHNGSIKAVPLIIVDKAYSGFQSHNGSIKACDISAATETTNSFNPTMVRLRQICISDNISIHAVSIPQWFD